jgi:hypothetical protein
MRREHAMDVAPLGAEFEPLHSTSAVGALDDIDEEDSFEDPRPRSVKVRNGLWLLRRDARQHDLP